MVRSGQRLIRHRPASLRASILRCCKTEAPSVYYPEEASAYPPRYQRKGRHNAPHPPGPRVAPRHGQPPPAERPRAGPTAARQPHRLPLRDPDRPAHGRPGHHDRQRRAPPHPERASTSPGPASPGCSTPTSSPSAGLLLLGARSGDLLGRRRTFLLGIAIFSVSSLARRVRHDRRGCCSAPAPSRESGAALAAPSALALLTTVFSEGARRVRAIGLFTTVSAAGGAIGLVAGGILTELVSWRWVMFVNVPIGLVGLPGSVASCCTRPSVVTAGSTSPAR